MYLYPAEKELLAVNIVGNCLVFNFSSFHWFVVRIWWWLIFDWRRLDEVESVPLSSSVTIEFIRGILACVFDVN